MENKQKTPSEFTHLFPEWLMCSAFAKAVKSDSALPEKLIIHAGKEKIAFSELAGDAGDVTCFPERQLVKAESKKWGIESQDDYFRRFWSLRPDFMLINENAKMLCLVEAKGGPYLKTKVWDDPKEIKYCNFLTEARNYSKKGFLYFIPKRYEEQCRRCISEKLKQYESITIGYGIWEEMLDLISDSVNSVFLEWLAWQSKGINILNEWQNKNRLR